MGRNGTWFCYMLECNDGSLYVGAAKDPEARLKKHNWGAGTKFTRMRRPVKLIWKEEHKNEYAARGREVELKGWRREKKLALISENATSKVAEWGKHRFEYNPSGRTSSALRVNSEPLARNSGE